MAVYAIGDVQGCLGPLQQLLQRLNFDKTNDTLWFTGDLVNRGPDSVGILRLLRSLGERVIVVLGNHDLHLLAVAVGAADKKERDTLDRVLDAPDRDELLSWLSTRPLFHHDAALDCALVHAGLLPEWDLATAARLSREVEQALATRPMEFFRHLYGDTPDHWSENLRGHERLRIVVNVFTRLRFCNAAGRIDLRHKGPPGSQPAPLMPWFQVPQRRSRARRIVFGHWSTLGVYRGDNVISLDSGCVWGRALTAVRIDQEPVEFFDVPCLDLRSANDH